MQDNIFKRLLRFFYLRPNSTRRILFGPMRGMFFRINAVTGLAPIYSGGERQHQRFFQQFLHEGMVVIDVGANWGLHTLYTSKLVGQKGRVVAIEPSPYAFQELRWHLEKNHCFNVIPLQYAAYDQDGVITLYSNSNPAQFFLTDIVLPHFKKETVIAKKLDTIIIGLSLQRLDLIKVDVEGAEDMVLRGSERIISEFKPYLIIELHDEENALSVSSWLNKRGYALKRLSPTTHPIRRTDVCWPNLDGVWGTILAWPR